MLQRGQTHNIAKSHLDNISPLPKPENQDNGQQQGPKMYQITNQKKILETSACPSCCICQLKLRNATAGPTTGRIYETTSEYTDYAQCVTMHPIAPITSCYLHACQGSGMHDWLDAATKLLKTYLSASCWHLARLLPIGQQAHPRELCSSRHLVAPRLELLLRCQRHQAVGLEANGIA